MGALSVIIIVLIIAGLLVLFTNHPNEKYCGCSGSLASTPRPSYYVYRPNNNKCNKACNVNSCTSRLYNQQCQLNTVGIQPPAPLLEFTNLGWKTNPGTDASYFGNSWAAGSGCSSVPLVSLNSPPPNCNLASALPTTVVTSNTTSVPYAQNYGSPSCSLKTVVKSEPMLQSNHPCAKVVLAEPKTVTYPAGPYASANCCSGNSDAYNLAVGVL